MLLEKAESGNSRSLKDIWAAYRKKEVKVEVTMNRGMSDPEPEAETISEEEAVKPTSEIKKASTEVEKIGDRIVKVQFIEYRQAEAEGDAYRGQGSGTGGDGGKE